MSRERKQCVWNKICGTQDSVVVSCMWPFLNDVDAMNVMRTSYHGYIGWVQRYEYKSMIHIRKEWSWNDIKSTTLYPSPIIRSINISDEIYVSSVMTTGLPDSIQTIHVEHPLHQPHHTNRDRTIYMPEMIIPKQIKHLYLWHHHHIHGEIRFVEPSLETLLVSSLTDRIITRLPHSLIALYVNQINHHLIHLYTFYTIVTQKLPKLQCLAIPPEHRSKIQEEYYENRMDISPEMPFRMVPTWCDVFDQKLPISFTDWIHVYYSELMTIPRCDLLFSPHPLNNLQNMFSVPSNKEYNPTNIDYYVCIMKWFFLQWIDENSTHKHQSILNNRIFLYLVIQLRIILLYLLTKKEIFSENLISLLHLFYIMDSSIYFHVISFKIDDEQWQWYIRLLCRWVKNTPMNKCEERAQFVLYNLGIFSPDRKILTDMDMVSDLTKQFCILVPSRSLELLVKTKIFELVVKLLVLLFINNKSTTTTTISNYVYGLFVFHPPSLKITQNVLINFEIYQSKYSTIDLHDSSILPMTNTTDAYQYFYNLLLWVFIKKNKNETNSYLELFKFNHDHIYQIVTKEEDAQTIPCQRLAKSTLCRNQLTQLPNNRSQCLFQLIELLDGFLAQQKYTSTRNAI